MGRNPTGGKPTTSVVGSITQFVFFLVAAYVILANFLVDIIYGVIDPRVSVGTETT